MKEVIHFNKFVVRIRVPESASQVEILDENFDQTLISLAGKPESLKVILLFETGVINERFNEVVNHFIQEELSENNPRRDKVTLLPRRVRTFMNDYIDAIMHFNDRYQSNNWVTFDVFTWLKREDGTDFQFSFYAFLPADSVSKEKNESFRSLGPDYLYGAFPLETIDRYVLPCFYRELAKYGLWDNPEANSLNKYQIGLH